jgi:hypothetical protein
VVGCNTQGKVAPPEAHLSATASVREFALQLLAGAAQNAGDGFEPHSLHDCVRDRGRGGSGPGAAPSPRPHRSVRRAGFHGAVLRKTLCSASLERAWRRSQVVRQRSAKGLRGFPAFSLPVPSCCREQACARGGVRLRPPKVDPGPVVRPQKCPQSSMCYGGSGPQGPQLS